MTVIKLNRTQQAWWADCLQTKNGAPISVLRNAVIALEQAPEFTGMLCFNEMTKLVMIHASGPRVLSENDITEVQYQLQGLGLRTIGKHVTLQAIDHVARMYPVHELLDELEALSWDGLPRLDSWLIDCLGVADTPYHRKIGRMFLISMVARILKPGCKADYMLVLEGSQGGQKSQACEILAGEEYFSNQLPELNSGKDASIHLRGKWLIEVDEMHAFSKAQNSLLKSFITRTHERYRPPYGIVEVTEPRTCVFIGTSNLEVYLRDETGNRRFWPVKCGIINIDRLRSIRNQLLAEAVAACNASEKHYPDLAFEALHIKPEQDARYEEDPWHPLVEHYLATCVVAELTVRDIASSAISLPNAQLGPVEGRRIASILRRLNWTMKHTRKGNLWCRGDVCEPCEP